MFKPTDANVAIILVLFKHYRQKYTGINSIQ